MKKRIPPQPIQITDLAALPILLTLEEMAALYRVSVGTIRRGVQMQTFRPMPFATYPYRWRKSDIERDLTQRHEQHKRQHGFAAKSRRAKGELAAIGE